MEPKYLNKKNLTKINKKFDDHSQALMLTLIFYGCSGIVFIGMNELVVWWSTSFFRRRKKKWDGTRFLATKIVDVIFGIEDATAKIFTKK